MEKLSQLFEAGYLPKLEKNFHNFPKLYFIKIITGIYSSDLHLIALLDGFPALLDGFPFSLVFVTDDRCSF